jgi:hypothetical protein
MVLSFALIGRRVGGRGVGWEVVGASVFDRPGVLKPTLRSGVQGVRRDGNCLGDVSTTGVLGFGVGQPPCFEEGACSTCTPLASEGEEMCMFCLCLLGEAFDVACTV